MPKMTVQFKYSHFYCRERRVIMNNKFTDIAREFSRCIIVGCISFIVDSGVLILLREILLTDGTKKSLILSTAGGFFAGLLVSYCLSIFFVFKSGKDNSKGKSMKDFIVFAVISLTGLLITEAGMYLGVYILKMHYMLIKFIVAAFVLIWNYCGRKIFIFK